MIEGWHGGVGSPSRRRQGDGRSRQCGVQRDGRWRGDHPRNTLQEFGAALEARPRLRCVQPPYIFEWGQFVAKPVSPAACRVRAQQDSGLRQSARHRHEARAEQVPVRVRIPVPVQVLEYAQVVGGGGVPRPSAGRRGAADVRELGPGRTGQIGGGRVRREPAEHGSGSEFSARRFRPE